MPARLIAGLLYLQHTFNASDEAVVNTWVENPYWQYFCGETYLQTELPIDPSSLTRWRKRVGEEGVETLLAASIDAARRGGVIRKASVQQVIVDTTVMPKAIAHPTDSRLLDKSRQHLVKAAEDNGLQLRQNYNRVAPRLAAQIGRYAHAKQFKRLRRVLKRQRTVLGRVLRDVQRRLLEAPQDVRDRLQPWLERAERIRSQRPKDKHKLYALHAPEVECIGKGKARQPYEFGVKVSVAVTARQGLMVGARSLPGNPYDGHTLAEQLEQTTVLLQELGVKPHTAIVDLGYRGADADIGGVTLIHRGKSRSLTRSQRRWLKRRQAVEPAIGHAKHDHGMKRCWPRSSSCG